MTRDEWRRAEPLLTKALQLPEPDREALIDTSFLNDAVRGELKELLRQHATPSSRVSLAASSTASFGFPAVPQPPVLQPGDTLEDRRFVVVRQIGRGGMGAVYLAQDTTLGTLTALKVLPSDERLITEARRSAVCSDHPNVAVVHNVLRTHFNGQPLGVLVMEYVAGTPASRILDDGPVEILRALRWARQVAAAIGHAHDCQVLHCDLKPANVIITPDDRAKVLDFGIARATFDDVSDAEPLRGTIPYIAPEQLLRRQFSPLGDIYSLGVTLFELVSGRRPFEAADELLLMQIVVAEAPPLSEVMPDAPPELEAVLARALAKDPGDRFKSARAFERTLEEVEIAVRKRTAPVPVPLWRRLGIALAWVAGALLAVMLLRAFTSREFNLLLGRSDFVTETPWDWLVWGRRASIGPLAVLVIALVPLAILRLLWRLLTTVSASVRSLGERGRAFVRHQIRRFHLDEVPVMSACALLVSLSAFAAAVYSFWDIFPAFVSFAATGSKENLALLSPECVTWHNRYRNVFSGVVILCVIVWYPLVKRVRKDPSVHWNSLIPAALVTGAALFVLHLPHRIMYSEYAGDAFAAVRWKGVQCYILGQRNDDVLLLCPELNPDPEKHRTRHREVKAGDAELMPLGIRESPYRGFHTNPKTCTTGKD